MLVEHFAKIICTIILSVKKKTFLHPNVDVEMEVRGLRLNATALDWHSKNISSALLILYMYRNLPKEL